MNISDTEHEVVLIYKESFLMLTKYQVADKQSVLMNLVCVFQKASMEKGRGNQTESKAAIYSVLRSINFHYAVLQQRKEKKIPIM